MKSARSLTAFIVVVVLVSLSFSVFEARATSWHDVETWNMGIHGAGWHDVEKWDLNATTPYYPYTYTFFGMFSEQTGLLIGNATVTVYSHFLSPFNVTVNGSATVNLQYMPSYFQIQLGYNYSRYYTPIYPTETICVFQPESPYTTYYVGITDFLGMRNATVESYVSLNGTTFTVERRPFTPNNKIPFTLTQFTQYGFRVRCSQGTYDFGSWITGDPSLLISFTVSPANFPFQTITYGNLSISVLRRNDTWVEILYADSGNETVSVTVQMYYRDNSVLTLLWTGSEPTESGYTYNWYDANRYVDYVASVTVVHSVHGTLHWAFPLPDPLIAPGLDLSIFGVFPFESRQLVGFVLVLLLFACFSVREAHVGLLLSIGLAALLTYVQWLALSWSAISICLCLAVLWALSRRRAS